MCIRVGLGSREAKGGGGESRSKTLFDGVPHSSDPKAAFFSWVSRERRRVACNLPWPSSSARSARSAPAADRRRHPSRVAMRGEAGRSDRGLDGTLKTGRGKRPTTTGRFCRRAPLFVDSTLELRRLSLRCGARRRRRRRAGGEPRRQRHGGGEQSTNTLENDRARFVTDHANAKQSRNDSSAHATTHDTTTQLRQGVSPS